LEGDIMVSVNLSQAELDLIFNYIEANRNAGCYYGKREQY